MRNSPGNAWDTLHEPQNYCLKCWKEFTTLTEEERAVFQILKYKMKKTITNFDFYEE